MMKNNQKIVLHPVTNEEFNSFVGIRIKNGEIHFHYPESYALTDISDKESKGTKFGITKTIELNEITNIKSFRNDIINIICTISLAKSKSSVGGMSENGITQNDTFAIISYLWIIRDYLANGYYKNSEKLYRTNCNGKINWKKTLETKPIVSDGNIIYNNVVVEVRNDCDDIITEAHKWCVFDSVRKIGWLFGINEKSVLVPRTPDSVIKKYINSIKTEIKRTFDDNKKMRLMHMLKVLSGVDDSDRTKEIVYGVDKYHYVYERMVDYIFSNIIDITRYNPNAKWYLKKNNNEPKDASSLRPDTIRLEPSKVGNTSKTAYVLDAKFYRFGTTGKESDLPTTTSIQKQITYGDNIICNLKEIESIDQVYNAFILPYNKYCNPFEYKEDLEYIGYSEANWRNDELSHVKVCAFLIDTKHLVTSWSKGNCQADIAKLVADISEVIGK